MPRAKDKKATAPAVVEKKPTPKAVGKASVQQVLDGIQAAHGTESASTLTGPVKAIPVVSTGSLGLDEALGVGGLPYGRVVEIFGPEASGKTTLCLHLVAEVHRADPSAVVVYVDAEHSLDIKYTKALGADMERLVISQPDYGEQALAIVEDAVKCGARMVVIDSVAGLTPKAELEGEMGDAHVGLLARMMGQALRKLVALASTKKCLIVFVNQLRMKIGVMFGSPETTPGGRALTYFSSVRLDVRRIGAIKEGEKIVASKTRIKVAKNKVAPPFSEVELDIVFGQGFSRSGEVLDFAVKRGVVQQAGTWFSYANERLGQGRAATKLHLEQHPELLAKIEAETRAAPAVG